MQRIERGRLRVLTPSGIYTFGDPNARIWDERHPNPDRVNGKQDETLTAEIKVIDEIFWARMLVLSDLGFAESFMAGEILVDDLDALFKVRQISQGRRTHRDCTDGAVTAQLFIINRESLSELSTGAASHIFRALSAMTNSRYVNSLTNAISNISCVPSCLTPYDQELMIEVQRSLRHFEQDVCLVLVARHDVLVRRVADRDWWRDWRP